MGLFSFIFGGGNAEVIAKSIAKYHRDSGDFDTVVLFYYSDFKNRQPGDRHYSKAKQAVELIENGEITNFVDLGALALWVDAAPEHYTFYEVSVDFSAKLAKYLARNGVEEKYITGCIQPNFVVMGE